MTARAMQVLVAASVVCGLPAKGQADDPQPPALGRAVASEIRLVEHTAAGKKPAAEAQGAAKPKAAPYPQAVEQGSSASAARKVAIAALPLSELAPEQQARVSKIVEHVSFFRRLPMLKFAVDPDVYTYFTQHPDVAVSVWRAMKISKVQMWQTGRLEYEADVGDGSTGVIEVLSQTPTRALIVCDGIYKSPLFRKGIETKSLVHVQTSFSRNDAGTIFATHRADVWVYFPSQGIDVAAKIFSPLAVSMTDATFSEVSLFLKMMSVAMVRRPDWVEGLVDKMDGVQDVRKTQIKELATQVYTAAQKRAVPETDAENDASASAQKSLAPVNAASATGPAKTAAPQR